MPSRHQSPFTFDFSPFGRRPLVPFSPFTSYGGVVEKLLIDKFLSHTESTEFTDFFLCHATLALELTQLTRVEPTETLLSPTLTAPAESNTFTMATVHFVPLRQVGRAKRRGWIKPLTFHLPFVWQVVEKLLIDKFLSHTESTEFTDFFFAMRRLRWN